MSILDPPPLDFELKKNHRKTLLQLKRNFDKVLGPDNGFSKYLDLRNYYVREEKNRVNYKHRNTYRIRFTGETLTSLKFRNLNIETLTSGLFKDIDKSNVTGLYFINCNVENIEQGFYDGFANLKQITLTGNQLVDLPEIDFEINSELSSIYMDKNPNFHPSESELKHIFVPEFKKRLENNKKLAIKYGSTNYDYPDKPNEISWVIETNFEEKLS